MKAEAMGMMGQLVRQWDSVRTALAAMYPAAVVQPADAWQTFRQVLSTTESRVDFGFGPVVFNLPERGDDYNPRLYVATEGMIGFDLKAWLEGKALATESFSTNVAYFRLGAEGLDHVFGAHYDLAPMQIGHPVFHSQLRSFYKYNEHVEKYFSVERHGADHVTNLLKTVRVPTAQMDLFCFVIQLVADHLLYRRSGEEEKRAFDQLVATNREIRGACPLPEGMLARDTCYRSCRWYPTAK